MRLFHMLVKRKCLPLDLSLINIGRLVCSEANLQQFHTIEFDLVVQFEPFLSTFEREVIATKSM